MEIRGEEFIKNLEIEKEKVRLQEQTDSLNAQKQQTLFKSSEENNNPTRSINQDDNFQNLDDIVLENNDNNKQKYIIFGFALVLLFLITIITIRLVQEPKKQADFTTDNQIEEIAPKEMYEKEDSVNKALDIDKIVQAEEDVKTVEVSKPKESQRESTGDIFGIENKIKEEKILEVAPIVEQKETAKIVEKKIIKKPIAKKVDILKPVKIKEVNLKEKFTNNKGYYIQVGAFTKEIDKKLTRTLDKSKYTYIKHKMTINGRVYNKVLVGSYKTSNDAKKDLKVVRQLVHNPKAYIMRIK